MKRVIMAILAGCISIVLIGMFLLLRERDAHVDLSQMSREDALRYFSDEIATNGPAAAYDQFSSDVREVTVDKQHILAHVFGEALYAAEQLRGFQACDLQFMYGCFHELMGRAIGEDGVSIVPLVYSTCVDTESPRPSACLHGIGHGIVASLGYSSSALGQALSVCDSIDSESDSFWCHSGVFMEYNQQSMLGTAHVRDAAAGDAYAPCMHIASKYQRACIFEQVPWWQRALFSGDSSAETFKALGGLCERADMSSELVRTCFEGIGNIVTPAVAYDPHSARARCESSSWEPRHQLYCKSMAALSLAAAQHDQVAAESVCSELPPTSFAFCLSYAHNEANMMHPLEVPEL